MLAGIYQCRTSMSADAGLAGVGAATRIEQLREQCIHDYEKFVNDDLALQSAVFGSEDPDEPKLRCPLRPCACPALSL